MYSKENSGVEGLLKAVTGAPNIILDVVRIIRVNTARFLTSLYIVMRTHYF